jgi:hypothetical protein
MPRDEVVAIVEDGRSSAAIAPFVLPVSLLGPLSLVLSEHEPASPEIGLPPMGHGAMEWFGTDGASDASDLISGTLAELAAHWARSVSSLTSRGELWWGPSEARNVLSSWRIEEDIAIGHRQRCVQVLPARAVSFVEHSGRLGLSASEWADVEGK